LYDVLDVVLKHDLSEVRSDNFGKGLSAQYLTDDIFLSPDSHFAHCVVIEGVVAETLSLVYFTFFEITL
jgi:hypothetical protein